MGETHGRRRQSTDIANRYRVQAIPTLQGFVHGKPVGDPSVGALPRARVDSYLDKVEKGAKP